MQLADALWRLTPEGGAADDRSTWDEAIARRAGQRRRRNGAAVRLLPVGHQKMLRAIAADGRVYGRIAEVLELSPGTAAAAVESLIGDGHVARRGDRLAVIDPLFTDWIRRRFPLPS